jgi:hypothetical protein
VCAGVETPNDIGTHVKDMGTRVNAAGTHGIDMSIHIVAMDTQCQ